MTEKNIDGLRLMTSEKITVRHAFTTRYGGVSQGIYESLNLHAGLSDDPAAVAENYARVRRALALTGTIAKTRQVHGDHVRFVSSEETQAADGDTLAFDETDALVTDAGNLALFVFTADCVPVLLHDPMRGIVGAVHSGWRGTALDIVSRTVETMSAHGALPENISAAVGPSIGTCCFETDADVPEAMRALPGIDADAFIETRGAKFHVDLRGIIRARLLLLGIASENIDLSEECTVCNSDKYWSHRKSPGKRGAQAAVIAL